MYNPQIQISAESETKRSIFREKDKTKRSKKESAQHSKGLPMVLFAPIHSHSSSMEDLLDVK